MRNAPRQKISVNKIEEPFPDPGFIESRVKAAPVMASGQHVGMGREKELMVLGHTMVRAPQPCFPDVKEQVWVPQPNKGQ